MPLIQNEHFIRRNTVSVIPDGHTHVILNLECGHSKRMHISVYNQFHKGRSTLCIPCSDESQAKSSKETL